MKYIIIVAVVCALVYLGVGTSTMSTIGKYVCGFVLMVAHLIQMAIGFIASHVSIN
jgi:hypothetical protein